MLEQTSVGNPHKAHRRIPNLIHGILIRELAIALCAPEGVHRIVVLDGYQHS